MRNLLTLLILASAILVVGCTGEQRPATPLETFKTYTKAQKKKDTTTMKLLLSAETLKAHEQEAKVMGVTVDDIVNREAIVGETQTSVEFRNEKIDGERATLEVKNAGDRWETLFFVLENGEWKIDKKGFADEILRDVEEQNRVYDEQNNITPTPLGDQTPLPPQPVEPINANTNGIN